MSLKEKLRRSLDSAYRSSRWHSVKGALKGLSEEDAEWRPQPYKGFPWSTGSINCILFHVAACKLVEMSSGFGDGTFTYEAADKLPEAGSLSGLRKLLERGQKEVLRVLDGLDEEDLSRQVRVSDGSMVSAEEFFDMLVEHDLYHAGQIRYVRNLIDGLRG
jgi:uncharacterized damage-inducible protein DinB